MSIGFIAWAIILIPLLGAVIIGSTRDYLKQEIVSCIAILSMALSFGLTCFLAYQVLAKGYQGQIAGFTWLTAQESLVFRTGLCIDALSITLMLVVTSISLIVHIYSLSYMRDDASYGRYFSYLGLFTFAMLALVSADNSLQFFFGWEAVGLVSYLLIGFWFQKPKAGQAALKAFLMNRAGDIGLLLGLVLLTVHTGSQEFKTIFEAIPALSNISLTLFGYSFSLLNVIGILLFIGAISKSAQIPLQVWLPDSMVGPTPVSALMHAATMVTAGIYMVARLSPIFDNAAGARLFILLIGSTTALFLGIVAIIQTDIKRVIAFSTISQLGYMTAGLGVCAYNASILHLVTHAYFKALLFLSAGSVILALHHEQSLHQMGGLWKRLPVTYFSFIVGALALMGLPPFSGFYSKDLIITSVYNATKNNSIATLYAFYALLLGVFITALYTGRLIFMVFHGTLNTDLSKNFEIKEPNRLITFPLLVLALPAAALGWILTHPLSDYWLNALFVPSQKATTLVAHDAFLSGISTLISILGLLTVYIGYTMWPLLLVKGPIWGKKVYKVVASQFGTEKLHQKLVVTVVQRIAKQFATIDTLFIDRLFIQGSTQLVKLIASRLQLMQSGWLYNYLLMMIMGLMIFLIGVIIRV